MDKDESLARACKDLLLEQPFYGLFSCMLNKRWRKDLPTAGVYQRGIQYELGLNEEYWAKLSDRQHKGLITHELMHMCFFHVTDWRHLENHQVANLAMDCEINQLIDINDLPPNPILPSSFPTLKLEPHKGTQYYYDKLNDAAQKNASKTLSAILDAIKNGEGKDKDGNPVVIIVKGENGEGVGVPDHSMWEAINKLGEAEKKLLKSHIDHLMSEVAEQVEKSRGTIPSELAEYLKNLNKYEPPKFDWKGYLRRFAGGSIRTYTKKVRTKLNKKFDDAPGLRVKSKNHVLVAVDTSGSVSQEELVEFFQEIDHIHRTGSDVTVIQCDAAISSVERYKRNQEIKVKGRGGTAFDPVIDYANEHSKKYTCLIYLTDGCAPAPEPCRLRTLWVHSTKSTINEDLIGHKIKLN